VVEKYVDLNNVEAGEALECAGRSSGFLKLQQHPVSQTSEQLEHNMRIVEKVK
jgi:hypothetical protein